MFDNFECTFERLLLICDVTYVLRGCHAAIIATHIRSKAMAQVSGISVSCLIDETERQYCLANSGCTEYALERLEYAITVCSDLSNHLQGVPGLEDYCSSTEDTIKDICTGAWYRLLSDQFQGCPPHSQCVSLCCLMTGSSWGCSFCCPHRRKTSTHR